MVITIPLLDLTFTFSEGDSFIIILGKQRCDYFGKINLIFSLLLNFACHIINHVFFIECFIDGVWMALSSRLSYVRSVTVAIVVNAKL